MSKIAFVKTVVVAGGLLFLCAAPRMVFGQSSQPGEAPHPPMKSALAPPRSSPPDLLEGLTLTDDQKAKIDKVREDTKSRLADVAKDKKLDPEAANAMFQGLQRIENNRIFEVLTPEQQVQVRRRMAAWRASKTQHQRQSKQTPAPEGSSFSPHSERAHTSSRLC